MSEQRKGPEVEMKVDGAHIKHDKPKEAYSHPDASRPDRPTIVGGDIKPHELIGAKVRPILAELQGGPFDGTQIEVSGQAQKYDAVFERDSSEIEPFVFDAEQHRRYVDSNGKEGKPNVVQGGLDTVTYKRTTERTKDGLIIFSAA